ncbi:hypothetical protein [Clostridium cuniculi]|uniref:hypothetical protein n=1 Tax=Clostridium cuniculi TaxID=2548455 RepID=UPI0010549CFD|nr:hypothetical protein [Clostridium cuniculi]
MSSKKDFLVISKVINEFINSLTEEQFSNLINGTGDIRYIEKGLDNEKRELYNKLIYDIAKENDELKKDKINEILSTKSKIIEFCKYFKINYKAKETNDSLVENILIYIEKNRSIIIHRYEKVEDTESEINKLAQKLEDTMSIEEAKQLIYDSKCVESKGNLLKLSKKLNVFTDREATYEAILENIIKSVVESKIRSYKIRKKM